MPDITLIATATFGVEALVKKELKDLGYDGIEIDNGHLTFSADIGAICRTNLWLRCAERVMLKMGSFPAEDFDQLYEGTYRLPWSEWLPEDAAFPVQGKSVTSTLHSVPTCQSIVKKAIADSLQDAYGREWFEEDGPTFPVEVALYKDEATLSIDTSGTGLHKRGYRELSTEAPLQETIASAMIYLSRWDPDRVLLDPFCGSGTIPIEAAMMARNIAPGLRRRFVSESWPRPGPRIWEQNRENARSACRDDIEPRLIMGTDRDEDVLSIARHHARRAGVEDLIHFQPVDFKDLSTSRKYGCLLANPPYGERLEERSQVEKLYHLMGEKLTDLDTWSFFILTSNSDFEDLFGRRADKRRKLYNGGIECQLYQYYGPWPPRKE